MLHFAVTLFSGKVKGNGKKVMEVRWKERKKKETVKVK